jgi:hypothetical protein
MHQMTQFTRALSLTAIAAVVFLITGFGPADAAEKQAKGKAKAPPTTSSFTSDARLEARALARHIDAAIDARMHEEQISGSAIAGDAEFLRRVYLDIAGHIPPAAKVTSFLSDPSPDKRPKLIDELLESTDYGKHQADIWQALLLPRNSDNRAVRYDAMTKWLEDAFNANKPWDAMVRDIVTASGDLEENAAVSYVMANRGPDKLTDSVTRLFLGVQLQCAQCHNHPFTDWKQDEYWGMAAFFSKVRVQGNPKGAAKGQPQVIVKDDGKGRPLPKPDSSKNLPAKFLQGEFANLKPNDSPREVLAKWMTSPRNTYFARAMVNRTWAQLFGRGMVTPIDDMHEGNEPSHPQLLADLAHQFAASGFDLKYLIRGICNSRTYQRASKPLGNNADASGDLFSRMAVKVLTPEQMFDSLAQALGAPQAPAGPQQRRNPMNRQPPASPRAGFVAFFKVEDADPTEYQIGIPQTLRLMNGPQLNNPALLEPLLKSAKGAGEVIENLYLRTLSRRPTPAEVSRLTAYLARFQGEPRKAYADLLWALLNSSEFTTNH